MDRYMIVIPAKNRAFNMKCDDGDSMKLETLQKLVGGPIEPVPALLSAEWAREKDVDGILLLVNEEGLMKERPLTNQRASEMTAAELVGPAVVAAKRGEELIGFAKPVWTPSAPSGCEPEKMKRRRAELTGCGIPTLDVRTIPQYERQNVAQIVFDAVQREFQRPEVREDYERWKEERRKRPAGAGTPTSQPG